MTIILMTIPKSYIEILNNVIILFGLGFLYAASSLSPKVKKVIPRVISGVVIGVFTIFIMLNPWTINDGLFFDVRSVMLSVSAYFFGFIPAIIAGAISIAYRASLGGIGIYSGIFTVFISIFLGLTWKQINVKFKIKPLVLEFYLFGLVVHFFVWLGFLFIPYPDNFKWMGQTFVPFILLFPLVSLLLLLVLNNQKNRVVSTSSLSEQQILLKSMIDSPNHMEIFAIDRNFNYLSFNQFHQNSMKAFYDIEIKINDNYLSCIKDEEMRNRIHSSLNKVLKGEQIVATVEIETTKNKYYEETYTPIIDKEYIKGITIISYEVTERKNYESSILFLSYHDYLTGLGNRRLYQQKMNELNETSKFPVSFIMADINGLKLMNDAFGHEAGDELLVISALLMKKYFAKYGEVCRIGGDEFVIVMPNTDEQKTSQLIEDIIKELTHTNINGVSVSISFGFCIANEPNQMNHAIKTAEEKMYAHKLSSMAATRNALIKTLQITLYEKNPSEEAHCKRVALITKKIGELLNMDSEQLSYLEVISYLHDIGKIALDEDIINKQTALTLQDIEKIKKHPEVGYRLLSTVPEYFEVASDILSHHEHYDGSGYPRGLKGEQIPLRSRILSIADYYDAILHKKNQNKITHLDAINEIKKYKGIKFDPKLVDLFVNEFRNKPDELTMLE